MYPQISQITQNVSEKTWLREICGICEICGSHNLVRRLGGTPNSAGLADGAEAASRRAS